MLHSNDDSGGTRDSRLSVQLTAGNYTIEATTYARRTEGSFTLAVATDIVTSETVAATVQDLAAAYNGTVGELFSLSFSFQPAAVTPSVQSVSQTGLNLTVRNRTSNRVWMAGTPTHTGTYVVKFALTQPGRVDPATTTVIVTCPAGHTELSDRTCDPPPAATVTGLDANYDATVGEFFSLSFRLEPPAVTPSVQSVTPTG